MNINPYTVLVVALLFVSGRWQQSEAVQKSSTLTRKLDQRRCDTFFHIRDLNGDKVRPT